MVGAEENKTVNGCSPLSLHIFVSCETKTDQLLLCPIYIEDQALIALCLLPMINLKGHRKMARANVTFFTR